MPAADLYAVDTHGELAWAVGYWGTVLRSSDGGRSWSHQPTPAAETLYAVSFADESHGWAVGANGVVLRSTDGGRSWTRQTISLPDEFEGQRVWDASFFDVCSVSASEAWIVGDFGMVLHTTDGSDWARIAIAEEIFGDENIPDRILNAVFFPDREHGWITGEFGTALRTTDGGQTWLGERTFEGAVEDIYLMDVAVDAAGQAVADGAGGVVIASSDGGASWKSVSVPTTAGLFGVAMREAHVLLVGDRGVIFASRDRGATWFEPVRPRLFNWLRSVVFSEDGQALAVGEQGVILVSSDAGESWEQSAGQRPTPLEGVSVPSSGGATRPERERLDQSGAAQVDSGDAP